MKRHEKHDWLGGWQFQMCLKFHPQIFRGIGKLLLFFDSDGSTITCTWPNNTDPMNWVWTIPYQFSGGGLLRFVLEREKKLGEPWKILMVFQLTWWNFLFGGLISVITTPLGCVQRPSKWVTAVVIPIRYVEFYLLLEGAHCVGVFVFRFMTNSCRGYVESPQHNSFVHFEGHRLHRSFLTPPKTGHFSLFTES